MQWWRDALQRGDAELSVEDRARVRAHTVLRTMLHKLRPDDDVVKRPSGPFYDIGDGPGIPCSALEIVETLDLEDVAPIEWLQQ